MNPISMLCTEMIEDGCNTESNGEENERKDEREEESNEDDGEIHEEK